MTRLRSRDISRATAGFARACAALAIVAIASFGVLASSEQETRSVKAGVYTFEQAERGVALYKQKCASCHAPSRFTDEDLFLKVYAGKPLWEMFEVISDSMPEDDPGGMKPEEYAAVIAQLLRMNGFPTGQTELPTSKEALGVIVFERP